MKQTFNYKPKALPTNLIMPVIFAGLLMWIALPIIIQLDIAVGGTIILPYPWTVPVMGAIGVGLALFLWKNFKSQAKLAKMTGLTVEEDGTVVFEGVDKREAQRMSFKVSDVKYKDYDPEKGIVKLNVNGEDLIFLKSCFGDTKEFHRFMELFSGCPAYKGAL